MINIRNTLLINYIRLKTKGLIKLTCSWFAKEQKTIKLTKGDSSLSLSDLVDSGNEIADDSDALPDPKSLLSRHLLQRCSPLMQRILQDVQIKHLETLSPEAEEPMESSKSTLNNHDLVNFRHMLAGPLPTEAALDKFCLKKKAPIILDVKYDGERTLISYQKGEEIDMISRNGKSQKISYQILRERIQHQLEETDIKSIKLDGEIVVIDKETKQPLPLGQLMKLKNIKNRQQIEDWQLEMEGKEFLVYIFDVVQFNGENLMEKPLIERRALIPNIEIVKPAEYRTIHFPEERAKIFQFFKEVLKRKYEGLILKGQKDLYFTNQTRTHWKKLKRGFINTRDPNMSKVELDLIVMGANRGSGFKNQKLYNSFLMGTKYKGKIVPLSNVGSGFNSELLEEIAQLIKSNSLETGQIPEEYDLQGIKADVFYKPQLIFQVHAQEFTLSPIYNLGRGTYGGLSLRFPSFKRIRDDKGVNEATTGDEILQLSKAYHLNVPK